MKLLLIIGVSSERRPAFGGQINIREIPKRPFSIIKFQMKRLRHPLLPFALIGASTSTLAMYLVYSSIRTIPDNKEQRQWRTLADYPKLFSLGLFTSVTCIGFNHAGNITSWNGRWKDYPTQLIEKTQGKRPINYGSPMFELDPYWSWFEFLVPRRRSPEMKVWDQSFLKIQERLSRCGKILSIGFGLAHGGALWLFLSRKAQVCPRCNARNRSKNFYCYVCGSLL